MRKAFQISGYVVNKYGPIADTHHTMTSIGSGTAKDTAQSLAQKGGYKYVCTNLAREAKST